MKRRIRIKGPNGDINRDEDLGPGLVYRSSLAAHNSRQLNQAIPPRKEHLTFINTDTASKHDPQTNPAFRGPIRSSVR